MGRKHTAWVEGREEGREGRRREKEKKRTEGERGREGERKRGKKGEAASQMIITPCYKEFFEREEKYPFLFICVKP